MINSFDLVVEMFKQPARTIPESLDAFNRRSVPSAPVVKNPRATWATCWPHVSSISISPFSRQFFKLPWTSQSYLLYSLVPDLTEVVKSVVRQPFDINTLNPNGFYKASIRSLSDEWLVDRYQMNSFLPKTKKRKKKTGLIQWIIVWNFQTTSANEPKKTVIL